MGTQIRMLPFDKIDQDGPSFSVEGNGVFIVAHAENVPGRNPGHFLNGAVPGHDDALPVDDKGAVREKINYFGVIYGHVFLGSPVWQLVRFFASR